MKKTAVVILLIATLFVPSFARAQAVDTIAGPNADHSPSRASIYSAVLPGLGQAYNKKYWKIPVIYAGAGILFYLAYTNNNDYGTYRKAFDYKTGTYPDAPQDIIDIAQKYNQNDLAELRDYYRRNMELSLIGLGLWYGLNILDACVDAHFFHYEISDELTMEWEPAIKPTYGITEGNGFQTGLTMRLVF